MNSQPLGRIQADLLARVVLLVQRSTKVSLMPLRQIAIMAVLADRARRGPWTVRGLAAHLNLQKPVITRALITLGALGWVRRERDEHDGRNVFIYITDQGRAELEDSL